MKEAANSLLKLLEEPPATVHLILLSENPGELLPHHPLPLRNRPLRRLTP